jgi:hypothetical protein
MSDHRPTADELLDAADRLLGKGHHGPAMSTLVNQAAAAITVHDTDAADRLDAIRDRLECLRAADRLDAFAVVLGIDDDGEPCRLERPTGPGTAAALAAEADRMSAEMIARARRGARDA